MFKIKYAALSKKFFGPFDFSLKSRPALKFKINDANIQILFRDARQLTLVFLNCAAYCKNCNRKAIIIGYCLVLLHKLNMAIINRYNYYF